MADHGVQGRAERVRGDRIAAGARRQARLARNLAGGDLAEEFLVAAIAAVLGIRGYLAITGYPQVGGGKLHIAHMLWGGLAMLAALLLMLLFAGSRVRTAAAWIGGAGFGTFIDEVGKFLTRDNDYFFRPAVALIYGIFVVIFLLARAVPRRRPPSRAERLAYAYAALTDLELGRLDSRRRARAVALLPEDDEHVAAVRALLTRAYVPRRPPGRLERAARLGEALAGRLHAFAADARVRRAVVAVFFLLAGGLIAVILLAFVRRGDPTPSLNVVNIGSAASVLAVGLLSLVGVGQLLRGARAAALALFYRATLVSIFVGQFFAFIAIQFVALLVLAVNLLLLAALRVEIARERHDDT